VFTVSKAVVTTTIRLRFDCNSTEMQPFDDLRYDRRYGIVLYGILEFNVLFDTV